MREEEQLAGSRYGTGGWAAALGDRPQSAARWPERRSVGIRVGCEGAGEEGIRGSGGGRAGPGAGGRSTRLESSPAAVSRRRWPAGEG